MSEKPAFSISLCFNLLILIVCKESESFTVFKAVEGNPIPSILIDEIGVLIKPSVNF